MSRMNELDLCIQEVACNDQELEHKITDELELHLNGLLPYNEMSYEAQRAMSIFETTTKEELEYYNGHQSIPTDDDDIPLEEDM